MVQSDCVVWRPKDQTLADQVVLGKVVNPNAIGIEEVVHFAYNRPEGVNPFVEVPRGAEDIRERAEGTFDVLSDYLRHMEKGPAYTDTPFRARLFEQCIRPPELMLADPKGTCIDWVILLASLLQRASLNPLILIVAEKPKEPDHAVLGYWLCEDLALPDGGILYSGEELRGALDRLFKLPQGYDLGDPPPLFGVLEAGYVPPDDNGRYLSGSEAAREAYEHSLPCELKRFCLQRNDKESSQRELHLHCVVDVRRVQERLAYQPVGWDLCDPLRAPSFFQRRSELVDLLDWYRQWWTEPNPADQESVLALVGEGGIGKTALVEALLAMLPGVSVELHNLAEDEELEPPDALVVLDCSAESESPGRCLRTLYRALTDDLPTEAPSSQELQRLLTQVPWSDRRVLLVLDSFETLQLHQPGVLSTARITDNELWRFLMWCCQSVTPVRVLLTSRFRIRELGSYRRRFSEILVPPLDRAAALELLRDHGVHGTQGQLESVLDRVGPLALLVEVAAVAICLQTGGEAARFDEVIPEGITGNGAVEKLIESYERTMPPEWAAVMRYLSLLSAVPVTAEVLASIVRPSRKNWLGTISQLQDALKGLSNLYLAHRASPHGAEAQAAYRAHDLLGSYFSDSRTISALEKAELRRAILRYVRRVAPRRLSDRRSELEASHLFELVCQLAALGKQRAANRVYRRRMSGRWDFAKRQGPYDRLSRLNLLSLGLRTIDTVLTAPARRPCDRIFPWQKARLLNDKGGFERELGEMQASERSYLAAQETVKSTPQFWRYIPGVRGCLRLNLSFALRNPARTLIHRGLLNDGLSAAKQSWAHERKVRDREGQQISLCLQAQALGLQGRVGEADACYVEAKQLPRGNQKLRRHFCAKCYALHWAHLLMRTGNIAAADMLIEEAKHETEKEDFGKDDLFWLICRLLKAVRDGASDSASEQDLVSVRDIAQRTNRREIEAWSHAALAALALKSGKRLLCRESVNDGIALCERYSYGLHWIDLQIVRGHLELETDPANAHTAARLALYGKPLTNERDPSHDNPEGSGIELQMVGAASTSCGYAWGEIGALGLLLKAHERNEGLGFPGGKDRQCFVNRELELRDKLYQTGN